MEKTRVPEGEKYWYILLTYEGVEVNYKSESLSCFDKERFHNDNYFATKESAETTARKLRAVLKGADVIEMPSEEEIEKEAVSIAMNICGDDYWRDCEEAVHKATDWLKSKIVK